VAPSTAAAIGSFVYVSYSSAENGISTISARKARLRTISRRSKSRSFSNRLWWIT
jgi:hypothetical protein